MNIQIQIECETIQDFHGHLLKIYEESLLHSFEKGIDIMQSEGNFDMEEDQYAFNEINTGKPLDDSNCYGSHKVRLVEDFIGVEDGSGLSLIAKERFEQIAKHERPLLYDIEYNSSGQLLDGALALIHHKYGMMPDNWCDLVIHKMMAKPLKERLVVAGALIAAEIDRLTAIGK